MSDPAALRGSHAPLGVRAAREALLAWVDEAGDAGRAFLQVRLLRTGEGRYEVRNARDVRRSLPSLETVSSDPYAARVIAQTTHTGEHRPLKTAPNLRQGWALTELDGHGLWTALEYLYPACAVHWHAGRTDTLRVTHWRETARRQTGIYSPVGLLAEPAVRRAVRACCGDAVCLRRVAWGVDANTPLDLAPEGRVGEADVPCPEACSIFVSFARQVLVVERSPRREVPGLGTLAAAEIQQLREIVGATASGTLGAVREGEFGEPLNPRRVRYLAARLAEAAAGPDDTEAELPCEGCPRPEPCAACPLAA